MTEAKKSLGQHWLSSTEILEAIIAGVEPASSDTILEIGPGTGNLSDLILATGAKLVAVEFDQDLIKGLNKRFAKYKDNWQLIHSDIRRFDYSQLPLDYKLIANIPYYLTSNLIQRLTEISNKPLSASILMQKEVAERIVAHDGHSSVISLAVQLHYNSGLGPVVTADNFEPAPKVVSQVLLLQRRSEPLYVVDEKIFFGVLKAGFCQPRKMLRSSLSAGLRINKTEAEKLLMTANIDPTLRAGALNIDQWVTVYECYRRTI